MSQTTGPKVPFTTANINKCMCPKCPVQAKSECVKQKLSLLKTALAKKPLIPAEIPAEYCSQGNASCNDIDFKQSCLCYSCAVYASYKLGSGQPGGRFCQYGMAQ